MRFLIDAQLPPALARLLASHGHVAEHVADIGLRDADDSRIELLRRSGRASWESPGLSVSRRRVGSPRASSSPSALYWLSGEAGEETHDQSQRQGDAEHEAELERKCDRVSDSLEQEDDDFPSGGKEGRNDHAHAPEGSG